MTQVGKDGLIMGTVMPILGCFKDLGLHQVASKVAGCAHTGDIIVMGGISCALLSEAAAVMAARHREQSEGSDESDETGVHVMAM